MSLFNRILPGHDLARGETKIWASAEIDGRTGGRVTASLDEDGSLRVDVVEWRDNDPDVVLAIALSAEGEVQELVGVSDDAIAPVSEFASRLRMIVSSMEVVAD